MNAPPRSMIAFALPLLLGGTPAQAAPSATAITFNFDRDLAGQAPRGFTFGRTGEGRMGRWLIRTVPDAPSGKNVLAQLDDDPTDYRFPIAVATQPMVTNAQISVRCKAVSGKVDQACGLVFRYQNDRNYYVTRANALEDNINLYRVIDGRRQEFAGWSGKVSGNAWHTLRADANGDHFEVYWDGKKVIDAHDAAILKAGRVGLWTKADSMTYFDDLRVSPIGPM